MKKKLMIVAWGIAKRSSKIHGGTAKEWFAYALTKAWKFAKEGILGEKYYAEIVAKKEEVKPVLRGSMTNKQERFIEYLLSKKRGKYEETNLIEAFKVNVRDNITKAQASKLIDYLLAC